MKFINQFDVMNNQLKSIEILKILIEKARNDNNIELISHFNDVLSTVHTVKNHTHEKTYNPLVKSVP